MIVHNAAHRTSLSIQPGIGGLDDRTAEQFTQAILYACFVSAGDFTQSIGLAILVYGGCFLLLPDSASQLNRTDSAGTAPSNVLEKINVIQE